MSYSFSQLCTFPQSREFKKQTSIDLVTASKSHIHDSSRKMSQRFHESAATSSILSSLAALTSSVSSPFPSLLTSVSGCCSSVSFSPSGAFLLPTTVALMLYDCRQHRSKGLDKGTHVSMTCTFSFSPLSLFSSSTVMRLLPFQP